MTEVLLGLGSNLGDRLATLQRAVDLLASHGVRAVASSRVWATAPLGGPGDQPEFLNAVIRVDPGPLGADEVLAVIGAVEAELGRVRDERWGPRTVDIDILLWGDLVRDDAAADDPAPAVARARLRRPAPARPRSRPGAAGRPTAARAARTAWRGEAGRSAVGGAVTAKVCLRCDWSGAIRDDTCPRCGAGLFSARSDKAGADVDPTCDRARRATHGALVARVGRRRAHRRVRGRRGGHRPTAHPVGGVQRGRRYRSHGLPDHLRSGGRRGPHVDLGSRRRYRGAGATAAPHARGTGLRLRGACRVDRNHLERRRRRLRVGPAAPRPRRSTVARGERRRGRVGAEQLLRQRSPIAPGRGLYADQRQHLVGVDPYIGGAIRRGPVWRARGLRA